MRLQSHCSPVSPHPVSRAISPIEEPALDEFSSPVELTTSSSFSRLVGTSPGAAPVLKVLPGALGMPNPARTKTSAEDYAVSLFLGPISLTKDEAVSSVLANLRGPALNRVLERVSLVDLLDQSANQTACFVVPAERLDTLGARARWLSAPVVLKLLTTMYQNESCWNPLLAMKLIKALRPTGVREVKEGLELLNPVAGLNGVIEGLVGSCLVEEAVAVIGRIRPSGKGIERRVFSDIDDTIVCGWKDARYPKHTLYPGATTFVKKLRQTVSGHRADGLGIALLTARPDDAFGLMRWATGRALKDAGLKNATKLFGGLLHVFPERRIIAKKFNNFSDYIRWFPEGEFVFIGDSGQKDTQVGLKMLEEVPQKMGGVFIHQITDLPLSHREKMAKERVWLFSNYVEAARIALTQGLLNSSEASEVATAATAEFETIHFNSPKQREARLKELNESLTALRAVLDWRAAQYGERAA